MRTDTIRVATVERQGLQAKTEINRASVHHLKHQHASIIEEEI